MSAGTRPAQVWLPFRQIVDVPIETCLAAVESWQRTGLDGELRIGESRLRGPIEHDRDSGTRRIEVRLARGPLRPALRMRLYIDRWSPVDRSRAHPLRARPAHRSLLPRWPSPARLAGPFPVAAIARSACPRHRESATRGHRSRASLIPSGAASPSGSGGVSPAVPPPVRYPDCGRPAPRRPHCPGTSGRRDRLDAGGAADRGGVLAGPSPGRATAWPKLARCGAALMAALRFGSPTHRPPHASRPERAQRLA